MLDGRGIAPSQQMGKITSQTDAESENVRLRNACQIALDFWGLDTAEFVKKYGHGVTTKDVADVLRAALHRDYPTAKEIGE